MTITEAMKLLDCHSRAELCRKLNLSRSAHGAWSDGVLPAARSYEVLLLSQGKKIQIPNAKSKKTA